MAEERQWAEENIDGIKVYEDFSDMLASGNVDAIVIASATSVHAEQTLAALQKGYHVLCEKPLSLDLELVSDFDPASCPLKLTHETGKVCCFCIQGISQEPTESKSHVWILATLRCVLQRGY